MRSLRWRSLISAVLLGLVACTETPTRPSAPSLAKGPADPAALEAQINGLIGALFAPTDQGAMKKAFARIKNAVARGDSGAAQSGIVAFVRDLLLARDGGGLQDPNGAAPPSVGDALLSLVNSVAQFGGLPPPIPPSNPFAGDGAVAVVGPAGGTVVSSTGFGGVGFPPGALPEDVIVVVARLPNPAVPGAGPLPTTLTQYPLFYDFSTVPHVPQFAVDVTVGLCQLEVGAPFGPPTQSVADRLQIAHPDPANPGQIELLQRTLAPFIDCDGVTLAKGLEAPSSAFSARAMRLVLDQGARLLGGLRPTRAYAVHGGLGGKTRSFSPFAAVDPGLSIVGVCAAPMANVLATYPTVDVAIANAAPGGVIKLCPQTITVPAEYLVDKPLTIEAETPASPPQFLVNVTTTPVAFRVNPVVQGAVTLRSLSFSMTGNATAIDLGLGQGVGLQGSWWQVLVENSQFVMLSVGGRAVRAFQTARTDPKVTIRNNQISGGNLSVVTLTGSASSTIEILSNVFTGAFSQAVLLQSEGSVRVEGNTLAGSGTFSGIRLINVKTGTITDNTISMPSGNGIVVSPALAQSLTIERNAVTGTGGGGPPSSPASYALGAGILIGAVALDPSVVFSGTVVVSHNSISNARAGIHVSGGGLSMSGTDNVVSNVLTGIQLENTSTAGTNVTIASSDFTSYFTPVTLTGVSTPPSTLSATCNWWGNAAGPQNVTPGTPIGSLTPFATAPVANGAGGPCTGVLPEWTQVGAGSGYSCALRSNGAAYCWGTNLAGRLGDGTTTPRMAPAAVAGGHLFSRLSVGDATTCGITTPGALYCWGLNANGELGAGLPTGLSEFSTVPVLVSGGLTFSDVHVGLRTACGRATTGTVYCWGTNQEGQLGNGIMGGESNVPVPVTNSAALGLVNPATGVRAGCARTTGNALYCWGAGFLFGNGPSTPSSLVPVPAGNGLAFQSFDAGNLSNCGILTTGEAVCWGSNVAGEIGSGVNTASEVPVPVTGSLAFRMLDAHTSNNFLAHTCGVTMSDQAYCWGSNQSLQLGANGSSTCTFTTQTFNCSLSPVPVGGGISFETVAVGNGHTCGLGRDRAVYCWGGNAGGQLGDGTTTNQAAPVRVKNP